MALQHSNKHDLSAGWTRSEDPFHDGELEAQRRMGVREQMANFGRRVIRDWMPDQHRAFYQQLPYIVVGATDEQGWPWASMLVGAPGFIESPDEYTLTLDVDAAPGDPVLGALAQGSSLGMLGIELSTRRRNRLQGWVERRHEDRLTLRIAQAFGNCPQYIQRRTITHAPERVAKPAVEMTSLDERARALIARSDTFFIATAHRDDADAPGSNLGADASHRGGKPGFVRISGDGDTLLWPDFSGNNHFNTIGNMLVHPRAGMLFIDFDRGDALYLTGEAEVIWGGPLVEAVEGAERVVAIKTHRAIYIEGAIPLTFDFQEPSPTLMFTGVWPDTSVLAAGLTAYSVKSIHDASSKVRSLELVPVDPSTPRPSFEAGQHIEVSLPAGTRRYSLSGSPGSRALRVSVERHPAGKGSGYIHEQVAIGHTLWASAPKGDFTLDAQHDAPVVLVAGGIGITPLWSMLHELARRGEETLLVWSVREREDAIFEAERDLLEQIAGERLRVHIQVTSEQGRITPDALERIWPQRDARVYLCGSRGFDVAMREHINALPVTRITSESFGGALTKKAPTQMIEVRFASHKTPLRWDGGSLLELALNAGVEAPFDCRSGSCGTCSAKICSGSVRYDRPPSHEDGKSSERALLCVARPVGDVSFDL